MTDGLGKFVEKPKEVAVSNQREGKHIIFGQKVQLQTPFEHFQSGKRNSASLSLVSNTDLTTPEYALFFEFKHYKEEKQKLSTRCFSFMEYDEIQLGKPIALEL